MSKSFNFVNGFNMLYRINPAASMVYGKESDNTIQVNILVKEFPPSLEEELAQLHWYLVYKSDEYSALKKSLFTFQFAL